MIETAPISEAELGTYCREKGLYPEQIQRWKAGCLQGAGMQLESDKAAQKQQREARKTIKKLQAEVRRKDRAGGNNLLAGAVKKSRSLVRRNPGQRGQLTSLDERTRLLQYFDKAVVGGAPRHKAAELMGLSERTVKRWRQADGMVTPDRRPLAKQAEQSHQLAVAEEVAILATCNQAEYRSLPPSQIVPQLADKGIYLASESSFYRVLKKHQQQNHRGRMKPRRKVPEPTSFTATGPNQVWSWDISYCPSAVSGQHWYLYLILDIYSRKVVAWEVHSAESGLLAKQLIERALLREGCWLKPPVLHSDNGAPMTSHTLRARLAELGMPMSHSRPRVSNDNPYSESLFRTLKYCPAWPSKGFASLIEVRDWMLAFENAYNSQHLHSGINFVTPNARHAGKDLEQLQHRKRVYEAAKCRNPRRWSRATRNWEPVGAVSLNPGKLQEIELNKSAA